MTEPDADSHELGVAGEIPLVHGLLGLMHAELHDAGESQAGDRLDPVRIPAPGVEEDVLFLVVLGELEHLESDFESAELLKALFVFDDLAALGGHFSGNLHGRLLRFFHIICHGKTFLELSEQKSPHVTMRAEVVSGAGVEPARSFNNDH